MQITVKNTSSRSKALRTGPGVRAILKPGQEALLDFDDEFLIKEKIDALTQTGLLFYYASEAKQVDKEAKPTPAVKTAPKTPAAAPKASSQAAAKAPADPTPYPAQKAPAAEPLEAPKAAPWQRGLEAPK